MYVLSPVHTGDKAELNMVDLHTGNKVDRIGNTVCTGLYMFQSITSRPVSKSESRRQWMFVDTCAVCGGIIVSSEVA